MTRKEMRECLYKAFEPVLRPYGFRLRKSEEAFVRAIPGGKQCIGISLSRVPPLQFLYHLTVCSRLNIVDEMVHLYSGYEPKNMHLSYTIISTCDDIVEPGLGDLEVRDERDVVMSVALLEPIIKSKIVPYLDEHKTLYQLEEEINRKEKSTNRMIHPYRGMYGTVLTYLVNSDDFEAIVSKYNGQMNNFLPHDKNKFIDLVDYIRLRISQ